MFASFDLEGKNAICLWLQTAVTPVPKKSLNGYLVRTCPFAVIGEKADAPDVFSSGGGSLLSACCGTSLALVGSHPLTRRRVAVWNGASLEMSLDFDQEITGLRLGANFLAVLTVDRVTIFDRRHLNEKEALVRRYKTIGTYRTGMNRDGLLAVNRKANYRLVLAFPTSPQPESGGEEIGKVTVICPEGEEPQLLSRASAQTAQTGQTAQDSTQEDRSLTVNAHDSAVAQLALNDDGTILATASERGTVIRVFSAVSGSFLQEFKRGSAPAHIFSLAFSPKVEMKRTAKAAASSEGAEVSSQDKALLVQPPTLLSFLCATSSTGTAHIFRVEESQREGEDGGRVPGGWRLLNYWGASSSCARFQLPPGPSVCAFHGERGEMNVNVISWEAETEEKKEKKASSPGVYYRYLFDPVAQSATLGEVQVLS